MPRMRILSPSEQEAFDKSPLFDHRSGPRTRQGLRLDHGLTEQEFYNSGLFLPGLNTGVSREVPDPSGPPRLFRCRHLLINQAIT